MEVVLLERVPNLGQMGDKVTVKDGYARNWLLPQEKALRATAANLRRFEEQKAHLEAANLVKRTEAVAAAEKIKDVMLIMIRQAGDSGHLYGSVSAKDVTEAMMDQHHVTMGRQQVYIHTPIKELGIYDVVIRLHPEVEQTIKVNVALSEAEALAQKDRLAKGEAAVKKEERGQASSFSFLSEAEREESEIFAVEELSDDGQSDSVSVA